MQNDYKGFIDLEDNDFFNKASAESSDSGANHDIEEKYSQLKRDFAKLKLQIQEMETEA